MPTQLAEPSEAWREGRNPIRSAWTAGLQLFALAAFALAQPLYDLIGRHANFLVAHQARSIDVVVLVFCLSLLPPLALLVAECLAAALWRPAASWLHRGVVAFGVALVTLQAVAKLAPALANTAVLIALVSGAGAAWGYMRLTPLRSFLTLLSVAGLVFPATFLLRPPVASLFEQAPPALSELISPASTTPVVMVILDEFSAYSMMDESEQIDAGRYPNLAALAAGATWFRNATTVAQTTQYAAPAILSGRYPTEKQLATAAAYPETLLTLLGDRYSMRVMEAVTNLCSDETCADSGDARLGPAERLRTLFSDLSLVYLHLLLPSALREELPSISATWRDFGGDPEPGNDRDAPTPRPRLGDGEPGRFARFLEWLREAQPSTFYLLHLELPHLPWKYLPSGNSYEVGPTFPDPHGLQRFEIWRDNEWEILQANQRYLLQLGYVDRMLGDLVPTLKESGIYDECLLVVVADHGLSFVAGGNRRLLTGSNLADIANVPLIVKFPGQREGRVSDRSVETIDLVPTIAEVLGIELPWAVDGRSLLDSGGADTEERARKIFPTDSSQVGEATVFGPRELASSRRESLDRMISTFGAGSDPERLYRMGPYPELLGRPAAELASGVTSPLRVELYDAKKMRLHRYPNAGRIPVHLRGEIFGPGAGEPVELVIAVNGTLRAATRSFEPQEQSAHFSAMVPESAVVQGDNHIEVFEVSRRGEGIELRAVLDAPAARNATYTLHEPQGGGNTRILGLKRSYDVVEDGLAGLVEAIEVSPGDGNVTVRGWAVDNRSGRGAKRVLFFTAGSFAGSARTEESRLDVAKELERSSAWRSGFRATLPPGTRVAGLRVFALSKDGRASELPRAPR